MLYDSPDPWPSWIEAAGSAVAAVLAVISLVVSVRTDRKTKTSQRLFYLDKQLRELVDRIETVDKASLSSPDDDAKKLSLIVAKKMQEYEALFSVYKHSLPHDVEEVLGSNLKSIQKLQDAALQAARENSADLNEASSAYINAMANFIIALKNASAERLTQVSKDLEKLT